MLTLLLAGRTVSLITPYDMSLKRHLYFDRSRCSSRICGEPASLQAALLSAQLMASAGLSCAIYAFAIVIASLAVGRLLNLLIAALILSADASVALARTVALTQMHSTKMASLRVWFTVAPRGSIVADGCR